MAQLDDMRLPATALEALVNDPNFLRQLVEAALNRFLDAEFTEHLQAGPYERAEGRTGYRNGYRPGQLKTRVGTLSLSVPMDRDGTFKTELFDRYQRSEKALVGTLMEMYLEGVSTRKGPGRHRGLVRHEFLQEHRQRACGRPGRGPQSVA